jgi:hypothetical protein
LSARAAAQLEYLGYRDVMHYLRGKADWMVRGLPCDPAPSNREKLRALPYFIINFAPAIRTSWIALSRRPTVVQCAKDDVLRLSPSDPIPTPAPGADIIAVVLNSDGVVLGAIEPNAKGSRAIDAVNPAPQTIRPDMAHRLAAHLLEKHRYILITTSFGKYLGRYEPPTISR